MPNSRLYAPTHASTAPCTKWPKFNLVNFNQVGAKVNGISRKATGMKDLPPANATIGEWVVCVT